ncbi:4762_t:CDS:1, partial [Cetraspora pellucida]
YEICKIVQSIHGNEKIIIHEYILVKERNINKNYYWCCEYRSLKCCKGCAITVLKGQEHVLKKFNEHNHLSKASHADIIQALNDIKETVSYIHNKLSQIIQDAIINMSEASSAICQIMKLFANRFHVLEIKNYLLIPNH